MRQCNSFPIHHDTFCRAGAWGMCTPRTTNQWKIAVQSRAIKGMRQRTDIHNKYPSILGLVQCALPFCGFWRCIGQETMHILGTSLVRMEYLQAMKLHDAYGCTLPRTFATNEFENGPASSTFSHDLILFAASKKHRYGPGSN